MTLLLITITLLGFTTIHLHADDQPHDIAAQIAELTNRTVINIKALEPNLLEFTKDPKQTPAAKAIVSNLLLMVGVDGDIPWLTTVWRWVTNDVLDNLEKYVSDRFKLVKKHMFGEFTPALERILGNYAHDPFIRRGLELLRNGYRAHERRYKELIVEFVNIEEMVYERAYQHIIVINGKSIRAKQYGQTDLSAFTKAMLDAVSAGLKQGSTTIHQYRALLTEASNLHSRNMFSLAERIAQRVKQCNNSNTF